MKPSRNPFAVKMGFSIFSILLVLGFASEAFSISTISGTVYDKQRNTLVDIEVELLDDYYRTYQPGGRTKTDSTGRYSFGGIPDGRYTVRVYAFRYDLEDQDIPVEVLTQSIRGGEGTGYFTQDFFLSPKKGGLAETELGVVFAQEIPDAAKKAYDNGIRELTAKRTNEGIMSLNEAVKIFPTYYLALHRTGRELFMLKKYTEAAHFLVKAAEVNPKSATTFYYLGYSLHSLGKDYDKAAMRMLNQAAVLAPGSVQVLFILGKVERANGKTAEAEKHLTQAKKLSKAGVPEIHKELAQLYADDLKRYNDAANELELYLKTSKLAGDDSAKTKKVIATLREKAKSQPGN